MGSRLKLVFAIYLLLQLLDFSRGNRVGVTYGRDATNLPSPDRVAQLVQSHNIRHLRIYDTNPVVFDQNHKQGPEIEGNGGIFRPDMSNKYNLEIPEKGTNPNGSSWCVASSQAQKSDLQKALDWACGPGQADCSAIQPGQPCFEPNELVSHASFAFNNYYQKHGATPAACNFGGTGIQVFKDPSYGKCIYS